MKIQIIYLISFLILFTGCNNDDINFADITKERKDIVLSRSEEMLAEESTDFAFRYFQRVNQSETKKANWMISPLSASMTLGMLSNGAATNTLEEIKATLGFSDSDLNKMNTFYQKLTTQLPDLDNTSKLSIANSIWINKEYSVYESFVDINKDMYGAMIDRLNFSSEGTIKAINNWCADNTNGKIRKVISKLPSNIDIYLLNALYFKGIWKKKFKEKNTKQENFTNANGSISQVPMMNQKESFAYIYDDSFSAAIFPYGNGSFEMVVILPNEEVSLDTILEKLTYENWRVWYEQRYSQELIVKLPRFEIFYEKDLRDVMRTMGMRDAFEEDADFSSLSPSNLQLNILNQYSYIKVNEEGTEAVSVTNASGTISAPLPEIPEPFYANRPFAFIIKEQSTGTILFMGKVTEL